MIQEGQPVERHAIRRDFQEHQSLVGVGTSNNVYSTFERRVEPVVIRMRTTQACDNCRRLKMKVRTFRTSYS
jgi:hypothetical protein